MKLNILKIKSYKNLFRLFFIIVISPIFQKANAQNIYDLSHSINYADYLFKSKEYKRAAFEYERVCFLDSNNWSAHFNLMQSYRKSNQAAKSLDHYINLTTNFKLNTDFPFEHEKNISLFITNPSKFVSATMNDSVGDLQFFKAPSILLTHNWEASKKYLLNINPNSDKVLAQYYGNAELGLHLNYKKPWLAGTMSTLVPGLGKVYTGFYKDGIIAFLFTGMTAYQAYRGYHSRGAKSGIFIIYAGMTSGFYLGNIYGSIKSARQQNRKLNEAIDLKTKAIFYEWAE